MQSFLHEKLEKKILYGFGSRFVNSVIGRKNVAAYTTTSFELRCKHTQSNSESELHAHDCFKNMDFTSAH